jgi:GT2 family glycosyltransferase
MELSIVILNYKTRGLLRQLLKGIKMYPPRIAYEVIVVDNGSVDGSADTVTREFPEVTLVALPKNIGYARGTNVGLKKARGEFVLLLNTDVVVLENSLQNLYDSFKKNGGRGIMGPQLKNPDGSRQETAFAYHTWLTPIYQRTWLGKKPAGQHELDRFLLRQQSFDSLVAVPWLMSSCIIMSRDLVDKLQGFDERFFVYLSDTDICRRAWTAGYKVLYDPKVTFVHYHRRQSADDPLVALIHILDFIKYQLKWRKANGHADTAK